MSAIALTLLATLAGCGSDTPAEPAATGSIQGVVRVGGSGISGVTVTLSGTASRTASTDADGAFTSSSLPAGAYSVTISAFPEFAEFTATVQQVDVTADATAQVEFSGSWMTLAIATPSPATNGVVGEAYAMEIEVEGGDGAWTWAISAGTLPDGLELGTGTGMIEGTPSASGSSTFTVDVNSGDGQSASREYDLTVYQRLEITTSDLPDVVVGDGYAQTLSASGGDGTVTWEVTSGALPGGLELTSGTGEIAGTPTQPGTYAFTVAATSGDGQTREATDTIQVFEVLTFGTASLEDPWIDQPYQASLGASGGDGDYSWSVVSGALPTGMSLDVSSGLLAGTPTVGGEAAFTAQVTSGDGQSAEQAFAFEVVLGPDDSCTGYPADLVVTFEDAALADLVRAALGLGAGADITCGPLPSIASLHGSGLGIADLSGIQNLTGLIDLRITRDAVADLEPLTNLTSLVFLDLGENQIQSLGALAGLTGLEVLDVQDNRIYDLTPLAGLSSLEILGIQENLVEDLDPLAGLTNLRNLLADSNRIEAIDAVSGLSSLEWLSISKNSVSDLGPLSGNTTLTHVWISGNSVSSLAPLSAATGLRRIYAGRNQISDLSPLSGMASLELLWMYGNQVSDVSVLSGLTQLADIMLTANPVADITPFASMTWVTRLHLGGTPIPDLTPLSSLVGLESLVLEDASITDISALANLTALGYLNVEGNAITDLAVVEAMTQMGTLNVRRNAALSNVQPVLDNPGIGAGDFVMVNGTAVSCADVTALAATGATVLSDCS